jgi:hypothetical protein
MKKKYVKPSSTVYPVLLQSIMEEQSEPANTQYKPADNLGNGQQTGTGTSRSIGTATGTNRGISAMDVPNVWE